MKGAGIRLGAITVAVSFCLAAVAQATGVHHCPIHDASVPTADSAEHDRGSHHHHGGADENGQEQDGHCCCVDRACGAAAFALPREQSDDSVPVPLVVRRSGYEYVSYAAAPLPFLLPFANGPPAGREA